MKVFKPNGAVPSLSTVVALAKSNVTDDSRKEAMRIDSQMRDIPKKRKKRREFDDFYEYN